VLGVLHKYCDPTEGSWVMDDPEYGLLRAHALVADRIRLLTLDRLARIPRFDLSAGEGRSP
jgi:hypothetical protein